MKARPCPILFESEETDIYKAINQREFMFLFQLTSFDDLVNWLAGDMGQIAEKSKDHKTGKHTCKAITN